MRNLLFLLIIVLSGLNSSCKAQQTTSEEMEKYDFELMKNNTHAQPYGIIRNGTKVAMYHMGGSGTHYYEYPPWPAYYKIVKGFYPNGNLKVVGKVVGEHISIGETIYYDEQGNITRVDEDKKFGKIKIEDILKFIEKEGHINLETGEGFETIKIYNNGGVQPIPSRFGIYPNSGESMYWAIIIFAAPWNDFMETVYGIDKDTGEVVSKESEQKYPIM